MKEKRKAKEIIGKPIKEYRLPLMDRIAYYRPFLVFVWWAIIVTAIVSPTIIKHNEEWWYWLLLSPVLILLIMALVNFIRFWYMTRAYKGMIEEEAESDSAYENFMGPPGSGKSYTAKELTYAMSMYAWEEISFEYWLIAPKLKDKEYKPTEEEQEVIDAYNFFANGKGIPCFASNIPCYSKRFKRFSYELEKAHLKQEKRLAFRTSMFWDEIGTSFNFTTARATASNTDGATQMDDFCRLIRQLGEFRLRGTEQDGNNIAIFLRRIASDNKRFDRKKWVLKPRFLFWLYLKLRKRFVKKMRFSEARLFGSFMRRFKKYLFSCGFFKFVYSSCGNLETQDKSEKIVIVMKEKKQCFYFPRVSEISYHTRAFKRAYLAKDKSIEMNVFNDEKLTVEQAKSMLKSENLIIKKSQEKQKKKDEPMNF